MSFATQENVPPISEELFLAMRIFVPRGGVVLELGSGEGSTVELKKAGYEVWSIEHSSNYTRYNDPDHYIMAPYEANTEFYDMELIKDKLPKNYTALLVDGPDTESRLYWFGRRHQYFKEDVHWFIDDYGYQNWGKGYQEIADSLGRELVPFKHSAKQFCVILAKGK